MKVSVVTVCYNVEDILEDTIKSVVSQTYDDVEYIIIDGASKDGTIDIIKKYSDKIAYWISEPDKGIYDAMNKGILAATGDYIIFMNAGDKFVDTGVLDKVSVYLNGDAVVTGRWRRCYANGSKKNGLPANLSRFETDMPICHQATFVNLQYHKKNLFDTSYRFSADYKFFYNAWRKGERFSIIDVLVSDFIVDQGVSTANISDSILEREKVWKGERKLLGRRVNLRWQILRVKAIKLIKKLLDMA